MRALIVGCGYVGIPLGAELARQGHEVFGLRRSAAAGQELSKAGIRLLVGDIARMASLAQLRRDYDWVVNCVSSSHGGAEEYRRVYWEGTRNLVEWLSASPPRKYVYTSSTGVYGQTDGAWVAESSPTTPEAPTAKVLVETEQLLLEAARQRQFPAVILRVAAIYGPGRGYWFRQFLKGEARIEGKGERWFNMIHRDDMAGAIIAALEKGQPGEVYNAVDQEPVTELGYFEWLAERLGKDLPPFVPEEPDAPGRKRGVTNKRVCSRRLREELGYQFRYPTFREGLEAELS